MCQRGSSRCDRSPRPWWGCDAVAHLALRRCPDHFRVRRLPTFDQRAERRRRSPSSPSGVAANRRSGRTPQRWLALLSAATLVAQEPALASGSRSDAHPLSWRTVPRCQRSLSRRGQERHDALSCLCHLLCRPPRPAVHAGHDASAAGHAYARGAALLLGPREIPGYPAHAVAARPRFLRVGVVRYLQAARVPFLMPMVTAWPQVQRSAWPQRDLRVRRPHAQRLGQLLAGAMSPACHGFGLCGRDLASPPWQASRQLGRPAQTCHPRVRLLGFATAEPNVGAQTYRLRFGIETSYRQMNQARIRTCTRDPVLRLLFVGIALILRNVWVWLHMMLLSVPHCGRRQLRLETLRCARCCCGLSTWSKNFSG